MVPSSACMWRAQQTVASANSSVWDKAAHSDLRQKPDISVPASRFLMLFELLPRAGAKSK